MNKSYVVFTASAAVGLSLLLAGCGSLPLKVPETTKEVVEGTDVQPTKKEEEVNAEQKEKSESVEIVFSSQGLGTNRNTQTNALINVM